MVEGQDSEGTDAIPLQDLGGPSAIQDQHVRTTSSPAPTAQGNIQDIPDPHPPPPDPAESVAESIHSVPHSQPVSLAENEASSQEETVPARLTTAIDTISQISSNVVVSSVVASPLQESSNGHNQHQSHSAIQQGLETKSLTSKLLDLKYPITAIIIVGLTASLMFTTDYQYAPLGSLGASNGILILNLLGKATDYSLAASADLMWETLQLGPMLKRGEQLLTYLALAPGASFTSWVKTFLLRRPTDRGVAWWEGPRFWSAIRLLAWAALQFPGLVVLAVANPQTKYYPSSWIPNSGGITLFDANIAASGSFLPNLFAGLVTINSILRDTTRTFSVDPISEACAAAVDTCGSYVILGGLANISPWPFRPPKDRETYYITSGEPVYQIDFWTPKEPIIWRDGACKLYGSFALAMKFCIASSENEEGQIITGWRDCAGDVTPSGTCNYHNDTSEANQIKTVAMSIYRRKATITASRKTSTILEVSDLSAPILQKIPPANFTTAFDGALLPWTNDSLSNFCITQSPAYLITSYLASSLPFAYLAPSASIASDELRNLYATSIYLFNSLTSSFGITGIIQDTPLPGLPAENYFLGSLAVGVERVVPAPWTARAYVGVATALLGLVLLSQVLTAREHVLMTSSFALVDGLRLRWKGGGRGQDGRGQEAACLGAVLEDVPPGDDEAIIRRANSVKALPYSDQLSGVARGV